MLFLFGLIMISSRVLEFPRHEHIWRFVENFLASLQALCYTFLLVGGTWTSHHSGKVTYILSTHALCRDSANPGVCMFVVGVIEGAGGMPGDPDVIPVLSEGSGGSKGGSVFG